MHLIDTNIAIYLRDGDADISGRIAQLPARPIMSILSCVELEGGIYRFPNTVALRRARIDLLLASLTIAPFDAAAVHFYGQIVATCGFSRTRILDRLIAATAIANGLKLLTMNGADFRDIPGIALEVWPAPPAQ